MKFITLITKTKRCVNMLMISELIKKLENFKARHGDLPVYHTIGFVADVEIDTVNLVRGGQCMLGNKYLDNYTMRTEDKISDLQRDMIRYAYDNLDCSHCAFFQDKKCIYDSEWSPSNVLDCFRPKSHVQDDTIYRMQHYLRLLQSTLRKETRGEE